MKLKSLFLLAALTLAACSSDDDASNTPPQSLTAEQKTAVVENYAALVHANYDDAVSQMKLLQTAIDGFLASPSQATLDNARKVWTTARVPYLQTEAFRFYDGPIDNEETGPEGRINGWPLDENFIDYTVDQPEAGIINAKKADGSFEFPEITKDVIKEQNEKGGEKNLSAGWHAIEFLLWGQDLSADGPGDRPYTDFVEGDPAGSNQDRRRAYLKAAVELMLEDMEGVAEQWHTSQADSYAATMIAGDPDEAIGNILKGIGSLAATELPKERMNNAYETKDQEEEHSCFSDTTNQDMIYDAQGIENVYLGHYGSVSGASISDLVKQVNPELDARMRGSLTTAIDATKAIPAPFDQAILGDDDADGRVKLKASIDAWAVVATDIVDVATALNVKINLDD